MAYRFVYDRETGQAVQIPDTPSDLRDFLSKGFRETPLNLPAPVATTEQETLVPDQEPAPPAAVKPVTVDPSKIYVNTATLPTLAAQLNISTAALRVLKNNRPLENFDQLNELVKLEGIDWTVFKDRLSFDQ